MADGFDFGKKKRRAPKKEDGASTAGTTATTTEETKEVGDAPKPEEKVDVAKEGKKKEEETPTKPAETVSSSSAQTTSTSVGTSPSPSVPADGEPDYSYEELSKRLFGMMNAAINDPGQATAKLKMKPPIVGMEGTRRTVWVNFKESCEIMRRAPEHCMNFVLAEAGTTGAIDGSGRLVIRGRFKPSNIEHILKNYIAEYVKCKNCSSAQTTLRKENRLMFMHCERCGATRSVAAITAGFKATTKSDRQKQGKP